MGADSRQEVEDLEQLIAEPGWARLEQFVAREWGAEAYRRRMGQLLSGLPAGAESAASYVLQAEAATREVERLMAWPRERLAKLRALGQAAHERATGTWPRGPA